MEGRLTTDGAAGAFEPRDQRERILLAAAGAVVDRGYDETTVADVARAAGVDAATVRRDVGEVEDCVLAACAWSQHRTLALAVHAYASTDGTWPARIRAVLDATFAHLVSVPEVVKLHLVVLPGLGEEGARLALEERAPFTVFLEPAIRERAEAGVAVPAATADFIGGALVHVVTRYALEDRIDRLPEAVPGLLRLVLGPFCESEEIDAVL
jgi:AcrR family transcriptional regulator